MLHECFTLRPSLRTNGRGLRAVVLLTAVITAGTTAATAGTARGASFVEPKAEAFTLVTFAPSPFDATDPVVLSTQVCVEAISKADLARARAACRDAVDAAHSAHEHSLAAAFSGAANRHDLAITYSNRAVMHQLAGEFEAARRDITRAATLMPQDAAIEAMRARIEAGVAGTSRLARAAH